MTQTMDIDAEPHTQAAPQDGASRAASPRLRLAYLATAYPAVSHTFIRREIQELERRGHEVVRLAIRRSGSTLVDEADRAEAAVTRYVLEGGLGRLVASTVAAMARSPWGLMRAMAGAWRMHRRSDRGLVRHVAYLMEAAYLRQVLARERIAHVHVHFGTNSAAVARLCRLLGGPSYSMTIHGPDEFDACIALSLGEKVADAAFTIGISHYTAAQLRRWSAPQHWSRIHVVRCTIDRGYEAQPPPIDRGSRTLVCIGRLSAQKGQMLLLEAAARLVRQVVDFNLVLAGDGELRPQIEQRIDELNLRRHVSITGWISGEQVREQLRRARAMVLPSFAEGLPVVIMESLAMGRPVISTFIAGIPELVEPGVCGWLAPAGDVERLAAAMHEALAAPAEQLERMGRAGRERVLVQHHPVAEVDHLERLLLSATGGGER